MGAAAEAQAAAEAKAAADAKAAAAAAAEAKAAENEIDAQAAAEATKTVHKQRTQQKADTQAITRTPPSSPSSRKDRESPTTASKEPKTRSSLINSLAEVADELTLSESVSNLASSRSSSSGLSEPPTEISAPVKVYKTKIFIAHLPSELSPKDLTQRFQSYGPIVDVRLLGKGNALITFSNADDAAKALSANKTNFKGK